MKQLKAIIMTLNGFNLLVLSMLIIMEQVAVSDHWFKFVDF